mmetsp:Transcript_9361/g.28200  ORF Transcript_9361/g.28200 Transcript_9361/m.28200 type:complete len:231 (-) Transcript_9361:22-714(-)
MLWRQYLPVRSHFAPRACPLRVASRAQISRNHHGSRPQRSPAPRGKLLQCGELRPDQGAHSAPRQCFPTSTSRNAVHRSDLCSSSAKFASLPLPRHLPSPPRTLHRAQVSHTQRASHVHIHGPHSARPPNLHLLRPKILGEFVCTLLRDPFRAPLAQLPTCHPPPSRALRALRQLAVSPTAAATLRPLPPPQQQPRDDPPSPSPPKPTCRRQSSPHAHHLPPCVIWTLLA